MRWNVSARPIIVAFVGAPVILGVAVLLALALAALPFGILLSPGVVIIGVIVAGYWVYMCVKDTARELAAPERKR
jgi:hypothetical protein